MVETTIHQFREEIASYYKEKRIEEIGTLIAGKIEKLKLGKLSDYGFLTTALEIASLSQEEEKLRGICHT